ncbi:MAG: D-alanyl-D-alanine carboxypeptidase, partial [Caldimonas sp.]
MPNPLRILRTVSCPAAARAIAARLVPPARSQRCSKQKFDLVHNGRSVAASLVASVLVAACGGDGGSGGQPVPAEIQKVLDKPAYAAATWGLHVIDLDTGEVLQDLNADRRLLIASVRKTFSIGLALDELGPDYRFRTPIHRLGSVDASGVLAGHLVLVASGDPAMGGRTNPDGTYAIPDYDHNEANGLGNAVLPTPDPLAGFDSLARQVAASGITQVAGDVVVDERLFEPFDFRGEFMLSPMFVNDDVVDVSVGAAGAVEWRPRSAAFTVQSTLGVGAAGSALDLTLSPVLPTCFGTPGCRGQVTGSLPAGFVPPLTGQFPIVRTFRITNPGAYARTVLIEALGRAGVAVSAPAVAPNPVSLLPASRTYADSTRVAELVSLPYLDTARHVMKVSYNLGADASLLLY